MNDKVTAISDNVKPMSVNKVFQLENSMHIEILACLSKYNGQTSLVTVLGVLELVKQDLIINAKNAN